MNKKKIDRNTTSYLKLKNTEIRPRLMALEIMTLVITDI